MKKLNIFLTGMLLGGMFFSCTREMDEMNDQNAEMKGKALSVITEITASSPTSELGVVPYLIPGANRGGNRTCDEVAMAFHTEFDLCGDKYDFGYDGMGNGVFFHINPALNVMMDGNYLSFDLGGCLMIEGKNYKVGAVIVKGSNHANVYWYPQGAIRDKGLAAPEAKAMVSNVTFCFIECDAFEYLFLKVFYLDKDGIKHWALLETNEPYFMKPYDWCTDVGVTQLMSEQTIHLRRYADGPVDGTMHIMIDNDSIQSTVMLNEEFTPFKAHVFYGSLSELDVYGICPDYHLFPYLFMGDDLLNFSIPLH